MSDLILHHFDISPFAEKVRKTFGLKGLAWQSVEIPMVMPKPALMPLTGGYRKTPVLQIGADIYCDTRRVLKELECSGAEAAVPETAAPSRLDVLLHVKLVEPRRGHLLVRHPVEQVTGNPQLVSDR